MKVLVCGGRDFGNVKWYATTGSEEAVARKAAAYEEFMAGLNLLNMRFGERADITILSGHARGADMIGEEYARMEGHKLEIYPADWETHGKKAGILRNIKMLTEGKPDLVIAFPGGVGTAHMVDIARKAGVPVEEVTF